MTLQRGESVVGRQGLDGPPAPGGEDEAERRDRQRREEGPPHHLPVTNDWSSPMTNAAETPPARIHPSGPRALRGDWLTRYRAVPPTSTTYVPQPTSVTRVNESPCWPAVHVPVSHRKSSKRAHEEDAPEDVRDPPDRSIEAPGPAPQPERDQGAVEQPDRERAVPRPRESGTASTTTAVSARSARATPMRVHPRCSPAISRARRSESTAPTANRRPMIATAIVRMVAELRWARGSPRSPRRTGPTARPARASAAAAPASSYP